MGTSKERILVVEDNPEIRELISDQTLAPMGYQVWSVSAASTAIQETLRLQPDVIIVNLNLPGLSGKDLLVALSSHGLEIPAIVIAEEGMEEDVIQAFRIGASDYLSWPAREAEILSVVERALKQVRERRAHRRLAVQLENTNQELHRRVRELTIIFGIGKAVLSITDQHKLFEKIIEGAISVSEADRGWLLLQSNRDKKFILGGFRNLPNRIAAKLNQPWDDGLSSLVALSGETLSIHGDSLKPFKVARLGKSALVVPLKAKDRVVGVMVVIRKVARPFSRSDQTMLEAVADYAAISLMNAQLFRVVEERAQSLQKAVEDVKVGERIRREFIQNASHELRTPLMTVNGYVEMLVEGQMGRLNNQQTEAINKIQEKLNHVVNIIEAMTTLHEAGTTQIIETVNLNDLSRKAIERHQNLANENGISMILEVGLQPTLASADSSHIKLVYDELLSNAIKFNKQGGNIILRVDYNTEGCPHVMIEDTGIGIGESHLSRIFGSFYQVDGSSKRRYEGLGIGLSLVKEIVNSHGGEIWVESKLEIGSKFHFTLLPPL